MTYNSDIGPRALATDLHVCLEGDKCLLKGNRIGINERNMNYASGAIFDVRDNSEK